MQQKNDKQGINKGILSKVKALYVIFTMMCIAILVRVVWIQIGTDSEELKIQAVEYSFRNDILEATRGNILADDGRVIATSIPFYEIRMDMVARGLDSAYFHANVGYLADSLSKFFRDKSSIEYRKMLVDGRASGNAYMRINAKKINYLELQRIKKFPIFNLGQNRGGFIAVETGRRVHPNGKLASRSIGFVNTTGYRVGIEGGFEDHLRGTDGVSLMQKISGNFWIPIASPTNINPIDGVDVVTTVDIELQQFVQEALSDHLKGVQADWGTVVVMETKTGHVKAIANATRHADGKVVEDFNYAVGMSLEPGSTMKIATMIALLDDAKMPLTEMLSTGDGRAQIGPVKVIDANSAGFGNVTLREAFEKSSNVGMAKAVNKYYGHNPGRYVDVYNRLGLNQQLGITIPGEAYPTVKHPSNKRNWDGTTLTMMSYGYALRVTPLHTLTLCNAVANDGVMVKPVFVKELRQFNNSIQTFDTEVINPKICGDATLKQLQSIMEGVVTNGTAKILRNPLYRVAAKTGTAQIAVGNKGYRDNGGRHYLGSVVGYFPAENPQYTIMVAIKTFRLDGSNKIYFGGALSSPLFKEVSDYICSSNHQFAKPVKPTMTIVTEKMPVKTGDERELQHLLSSMKVAADRRMLETLVESERRDTTNRRKPDAVWIAPELNVRGYTMSRAVAYLEQRGYNVESEGRGVVVNQTIDSTGRRVKIYLK